MNENTTQALNTDQIPPLGPHQACIVQIYGGEIGRHHPITREITVGRDDDNTVVIDMDTVSRHHARFDQRGEIYYVDDCGSTNGTYVNDRRVRRQQPLANGDLIKIGSAVFKFISGGNIEALYHEEIYRMTIIDGLTQVHNKRYFLDSLEREVARSSRYGRELSLMMFDLDHFKKLNDTHGHLAGDHVLKKLAEMIIGNVRREDLFARFGGEEFVLVLPETNSSEATALGESLRCLVEATLFEFDGEEIRATISIGVASLEEPLPPPELVKLADERLYEAKRGGRNRVVAG